MLDVSGLKSQRNKFSFRATVAIFASAFLVFSLGAVSSTAAGEKVGQTCAKANKSVKVTGGSLVCAKKGKKLKWAYPKATVRLAVASSTIQANNDVAVIAVAKGMKYYAKENLEVETILTAGSTAAVQAVASGQADITASGLSAIMAASQRNVPLKAIGGLVSVFPWRIAVLPDSPIRTTADLKGKKIGIISLTSSSYPYARGVAEGANLDADKDVQYVVTGLGAPAANALTNGSVDALALYTAVYEQIKSAGTAIRYLDNPASFSGVRSISWTASNAFIESQGQVIERFLRASNKALTFSGTSPEKAMYVGYEVYPVLLAGSTKAARIEPDIRALTAWLESAGISEPGTTKGWPKTWGDIPFQDWLRSQAFAQTAGQIKGPITIDDVWEPKFLKAANDFKRASIIKQAKKYKPNTN